MDFDIKKVVVIKGSKLEFSLKTKVGAGGNGIVYDIDIISSKIKVQDRDYVVKILKNDQTKMGERKRRFINEINSARKLCRLFNNKKILPIIDCNIDDTDNNDLWYVMPKAKPLWQFLKERNSIREKIRYMIQVAEIIKSLRDNKCAHRDIKPDNIFLLDNEVFLGDLGIVWNKENDLQLTTFYEAVGPQGFLPPEMEKISAYAYKGDKYPVDVYEFAKTAWAFLTKRKNGFSGSYDSNVLGLTVTNVKNVANYNGEIKTWGKFEEFLERATQYDALDRPNIEECMKLIDDWLKGNRDRQLGLEQEAKSIAIKIHRNIIPGRADIMDVKDIVKGIQYLSKQYLLNIPFYGCIKIADVSIISNYIEITSDRDISFRFLPKQLCKMKQNGLFLYSISTNRVEVEKNNEEYIPLSSLKMMTQTVNAGDTVLIDEALEMNLESDA